MNSMLSLMILLILLIIRGEIYDQPKIVRKILKSLIEDFRPKVIVMTESKDVDTILVDELIGSLQPYELDLPKTNKSK